MAKKPGVEAARIYTAAEQFVEQGLKQDGALFSPQGHVWTLGALTDLDQRLVQRPDTSKDDFDVGALRHGDDRARLDRQTLHYGDAVLLARQVLCGHGRSLEAGQEPVWTFLIRTPSLVEEGLRNILVQALPHCGIAKRGLRLSPSTMTLNPDLVFSTPAAVADVKYKLATAVWRRPDLYQAVAFATGFGVSRAAVVQFHARYGAVPPNVAVGSVEVAHVGWPTGPDVSPAAAATSVVGEIVAWLQAS